MAKSKDKSFHTPHVEDRAATRAKENASEAADLAQELRKGYYWRVALPHQPVVNVQAEEKEDAIKIYNKWAGILGTDHEYTTEKVPIKGPRLYEKDTGDLDDNGKRIVVILYGTPSEKGKPNVAIPLPKKSEPVSA